MAEIKYSFDVSVCVYVCLCVRSMQNDQSDQFKTVKATDFKFGKRVYRDSTDMMLLKFFEKGRGQGQVTL